MIDVETPDERSARAQLELPSIGSGDARTALGPEPMTPIDDLLESDEQVVYATKTSWIAPVLTNRTGTLLVVVGVVALTARPLATRAALVLTGAELHVPGGVDILLRITALLAISFGATLLVQSFTERWLSDCFVTNRRVLTLQQVAQTSPLASRASMAGEGSPHAVAWVWLESVGDVGVDQPLLGIWFDFGTVELLPKEAPSEPVALRRIRRPAELSRAILDQLPSSD